MASVICVLVCTAVGFAYVPSKVSNELMPVDTKSCAFWRDGLVPDGSCLAFALLPFFVNDDIFKRTDISYGWRV